MIAILGNLIGSWTEAERSSLKPPDKTGKDPSSSDDTGKAAVIAELKSLNK